MEDAYRLPCLGVFPYANGIDLDDEDSLSIPRRRRRRPQCLWASAARSALSTNLQYHRFSPARSARNWISLLWTNTSTSSSCRAPRIRWPISNGCRSQGLAEWILGEHRRGATVIGVCGGFQMLGESICDPYAMESNSTEVAGLGLLPIRTVLQREKTTRVVQARTPSGHAFSAYEIHLGETTQLCSDPAPFALLEDGTHDGLRADRVIGTYLHGALEDTEVLAELGIIAVPADLMPFNSLANWFAPYGKVFEELFL